MSFQEEYQNFLMHYGVKGMRWGVRKEYIPHPRKSKNSKIVNKKIKDLRSKKYNERLKESGFSNNIMDMSGAYYSKVVITSKPTIKSASVSVELDNGRKSLSEEEVSDLAIDVANNFDKYFDSFSDKLADRLIGQGNRPWKYEDSKLSDSEIKDDFKKNLGAVLLIDPSSYETSYAKGYADMQIFNDGTGYFNASDGGAYFGHMISAEVDFKNPSSSIIYYTIEG